MLQGLAYKEIWPHLTSLPTKLPQIPFKDFSLRRFVNTPPKKRPLVESLLMPQNKQNRSRRRIGKGRKELRWWKRSRHEQIPRLQMGRTCSRNPRLEVNSIRSMLF